MVMIFGWIDGWMMSRYGNDIWMDGWLMSTYGNDIWMDGWMADE